MAIFGAICLTAIFLLVLQFVTRIAIDFVDEVYHQDWSDDPMVNVLGVIFTMVSLAGCGFVFIVITKTFLRMFT